jgi:hypothetical protein
MLPSGNLFAFMPLPMVRKPARFFAAMHAGVAILDLPYEVAIIHLR